MFFGSLAFVFEVMLYLGLGLPLVNLLISLIGGIGGSSTQADADIDVDMDMDMDISVDGGIDGGAEFDIDAPELDIDVDSVDLDAGGGAFVPSAAQGFVLRFNLYCLCLAFVVMGAMGIFALQALSGALQLAVLIGGAALAIGAYILLYRFVVWPMKKNPSHALAADGLCFRHARVSFRIEIDSPGTIQTKDAVGATISYRAQIDESICRVSRIEEGEEIVITEVDSTQGLCYVIPAQRKTLK